MRAGRFRIGVVLAPANPAADARNAKVRRGQHVLAERMHTFAGGVPHVMKGDDRAVSKVGQGGLNIGRHGFAVIRSVVPKQPDIASPLAPEVARKLGAEIDQVIELFTQQVLLPFDGVIGIDRDKARTVCEL